MFDSEIERLLYSKVLDKKMVTFDQILPPCKILQVLSMEDIYQLNKLAKSKKYAARPKEKFALIDQIMQRRGFKKLAAGTNRIVYKYLEDQSFVIKVAHCKVALTDNIQEMYNQNLLAPFVSKVFEVSPCGTVGMFERVSPISNRQQFMSIASDVYDIIINHFLGKYVLDDFGSKFFMNWGVRAGYFPVLLDYPYVYQLDGAKLYCNKPDPFSNTGYCGGEIDYDDGFNHLICKKCGKNYFASDLKITKDNSSPSILVDSKGDIKMQVLVTKNDEVISSVDTSSATSIYEKNKSGKPIGNGLAYREKKRKPSMTVVVDRNATEQVEPELDNNQIPKKPDMDVLVRTKDSKVQISKSTEKFMSDVVIEKKTEDEAVSENNAQDINEEVINGSNSTEEASEDTYKDLNTRLEAAKSVVEIVGDDDDCNDCSPSEDNIDEY